MTTKPVCATPTTWELTFEARPTTLNAERASHWSARAQATREWREAFGWLAKQQKIPRLTTVTIEVVVESKTRRLADVGAAWPATKAAVDGVVDAGVLDDDGPSNVLAVTLHAPVHTGRDALTLRISEADPTTTTRRSTTP